MNRCHDIEPLLSLLLDDELPDDERSRVDRHLQACPWCAHRYERLAQIDRWIATPERALPADLLPRLERRARRRRWTRTAWSSAACAAAGLIALVVWPSHSGHAEAESLLSGPQQLQLIHRVQESTISSTLKACEWDLRALKLELEQLSGDSEQVQAMMVRLEQLLQRIRQQQESNQSHET
jgi:anti-sigma factor RsiW